MSKMLKQKQNNLNVKLKNSNSLVHIVQLFPRAHSSSSRRPNIFNGMWIGGMNARGQRTQEREWVRDGESTDAIWNPLVSHWCVRAARYCVPLRSVSISMVCRCRAYGLVCVCACAACFVFDVVVLFFLPQLLTVENFTHFIIYFILL